MKITVTESMFVQAFRETRPDNFSGAGLRALFAYLCELEEDCGISIELDVVAICCEWSEFDDLAQFHEEYDREQFPDEEAIRDHTLVVPLDGAGFIIQDF